VQVRISSEALAAIRAHAAEAPGVEVCGLLLGREGQVTTALRTVNVANDPTRSFEIDPKALIAAHRAERAGGPKLLGNYHSHPNGRPQPSATDLACSAGDGALWLIVTGQEVRAWVAKPRDFSPVRLVRS
jgi:desampylase